MGKWDVRSFYPGGGTDNNVPHINNNGKDGQNFYADINVRRHSESLYKDVLRQPLFNSAIKKLQPSTWYTFSFWERSGVNDLVVNQTSSDYGFATKQLYLFKGQKYKLYVNGRIDRRAQLDGKTLTIFLYNDSWSWVKDVRITSTFNTTAFLEFNDVPADG